MPGKMRYIRGQGSGLSLEVRVLTFSLATIASQREAEVTQAPMAGPLAAMMMGLGKSRKASNTAWLLVLIRPCSFLGCIGWMAALRLTPAQ